MEKPFRKQERTWTTRRIIIIILVATVYSIWFDFLDTLVYCHPQGVSNDCKSIGEIFGGNQSYQVWNIAGHFVPGVTMFIFRPIRIELVFVGFLISTIIMDSPLWGVERLWHGNVLWQEKQSQTTSFIKWLTYYYNPFGLNRVWDHDWLFSNFPTASTIFWGLIARIVCVTLWIWRQNKVEAEGREFSIERLSDITKFITYRPK